MGWGLLGGTACKLDLRFPFIRLFNLTAQTVMMKISRLFIEPMILVVVGVAVGAFFWSI